MVLMTSRNFGMNPPGADEKIQPCLSSEKVKIPPFLGKTKIR